MGNRKEVMSYMNCRFIQMKSSTNFFPPVNGIGRLYQFLLWMSPEILLVYWLAMYRMVKDQKSKSLLGVFKWLTFLWRAVGQVWGFPVLWKLATFQSCHRFSVCLFHYCLLAFTIFSQIVKVSPHSVHKIQNIHTWKQPIKLT